MKRALGVKLALKGWAYRAISEELNVSASFISKWKKRCKESGIAGLKLSYKGATRYLTEQQRQEVITWLKSQSYWDLSELEGYLIDQYDVVFKSPKSYYELLKSARKSWQKAQKKHPNRDPELINSHLAPVSTSFYL